MSVTKQEIIAFGKAHGYNGDYIYQRHQDVAGVIDDAIRANQLTRGLNIGCGLGILEHFLEQDIPIHGIDTNNSEIELSREFAKKSGKAYTYEHADLYTYVPERTFDLIIASEIIEHVPDDTKALQALFRLLKKKGILVLTVPNKWQPRNRIRKILGMPSVVMDPTHVVEYSFDGIQKLCQDNGFYVESRVSSVLYFPCERFVRAFIPIESRLRRWIITQFPTLASHFILTLRKADI